MLQEEAKKRQAVSGPGFYGAKPLVAEMPQVVPDNDFKELQGRTREIAAKAVGVSGRLVQKALAVKKADPEKFEKIKRGETTVEGAHRKIHYQRW